MEQAWIATRLGCLLLAAGGGTRLGGGKLLLPWQGRALVAHALSAVLEAGEFLSLGLVLGHGAEAVRACLENDSALSRQLHYILNPAWQEGQSSSLRSGLAALCALPQGAQMQAVLVMLGDQPLIAPATLRTLCLAHAGAVLHDASHLATAPVFEGRRGNPVILSRGLFEAIFALQGDIGARQILQGLGADLLGVPVDDAGVVHDVDSPEAYADLQALSCPRPIRLS